MIALPPGCKVVYSIYIDINKLDDEVIEWYRTIDGEVRYDKYYGRNGKSISDPYVRYGKGKWCHYHHNGVGGAANGVRLHFMGSDASVASMCLLKFSERVTSHNMQEAMDRWEQERDYK